MDPELFFIGILMILPMQNFVTLAAFFLVEKYGPRKKKKTNNARKYGHYVALAYAHCSDQYVTLTHALRLDQLNFTPKYNGGGIL